MSQRPTNEKSTDAKATRAVQQFLRAVDRMVRAAQQVKLAKRDLEKFK